MKKEELPQLVIKVQKGDSNAANTLFTDIYNDIYYFAFKTVKEKQLAEDITQEAMIAILKNISTLKDPVAFPAWSRQVTYSQCTRHFRKTKDVLLTENEDGTTAFDILEEESTDFLPDEALNKKDLQKTVNSFIDSLSPDHRATVMLYYFDELSVSKIADIQGITEAAVKSRLYFARQAIKKKVEEYEKKTGTRLHAIPFIPFIKLIFSSDKASVKPSGSVVKATKKSALSAYSTASGITASTGGLAGLSVLTKVIAGVLAAAIVAAPIAYFAGKAIIENKQSKDSDIENTKDNNSLSVNNTDDDKANGLTVKTVDNVTYVKISELKSKKAEFIMADGKDLFEDYTAGEIESRYEDSYLACPGSIGTEPKEDVTSLTILSELDGTPVWKPVGDFSAIFPNITELILRCSSAGGIGKDNSFIGYKDTLTRLVLGQKLSSIYDQFKDFSQLKEIAIEEGGANTDLEGLFIPYFIGTPYHSNEENWEIQGSSKYLICSGMRVCVEPYFRKQNKPSGLCEWDDEEALFIPAFLAGGKDKLLITNEEDNEWHRMTISPELESYYTDDGEAMKIEFTFMMTYCFANLIWNLF
ncbi:MAG: RNA polymerase sigma factor [Clostridia bacterium]|nr:RNA polymerase sigma factor [Clostridia bacterium]